jgi:hypothetical protein
MEKGDKENEIFLVFLHNNLQRKKEKNLAYET